MQASHLRASYDIVSIDLIHSCVKARKYQKGVDLAVKEGPYHRLKRNLQKNCKKMKKALFHSRLYSLNRNY